MGELSGALSHFSLSDMIQCGAEIRRLGAHSTDDVGFCSALVRSLYGRLRDDEGQPALALARFFQTCAYEELGAELQAIVPASLLFPRQSFNVTLISYRDRLDIGLLACRRTIPDLPRLASRFLPAYDELVGALR